MEHEIRQAVLSSGWPAQDIPDVVPNDPPHPVTSQRLPPPPALCGGAVPPFTPRSCERPSDGHRTADAEAQYA